MTNWFTVYCDLVSLISLFLSICLLFFVIGLKCGSLARDPQIIIDIDSTILYACNNIRQLFTEFSSQISSDFMSFCAEHMPVPAALLIMTGVIVIEMLAQNCVSAELYGLTVDHLCQRALGKGGGLTADKDDRKN